MKITHELWDQTWDRLTYSKQKFVANSLRYIALFGALFVIIFPIYWALITALRPPAEIYSRSTTVIPREISIYHFQSLFNTNEFIIWIGNSIIISIGVVILTTAASTLGGYGLTRVDIPQKRNFARMILFGYMFPSILLAIPMFILWQPLGLVNSHLGVIFGITASTLPFCLWLMWQFFQSVPISMEESAQMAGASRFRAFYEIALPMAKPGIIAIAVFSYAVAWNAYTLPKVLLNDQTLWPVTLGLETFVQTDQILFGELMAGTFIALIPPFIFVFFLQKHLLLGFNIGNLK